MLRIFVFSLMSIAASGIGREQSVAAHGRLLCKGEPATGITVKLMDHNMITSDTMLAQVDTDPDGHFDLAGHLHEISTVNPEIKIYHHCDHFFKQCTKLRIPTEYVGAGHTPPRRYDMGTVHLEAAADTC